MKELNELKELLTSQNTKHKQYGQAVQEGYFEQLEEKIILGSSPKNNNQQHTSKNKSLYISLAKYASIAAAVLLLFFGVSVLTQEQDDTYVDLSNDTFDSEYLLENEDIYTEDLLEIEGIDEVLDELEQQLLN